MDSTSTIDNLGVGGQSLGADPIAIGTAEFARKNGLNFRPFIIRKGHKDHGARKCIEGDLKDIKEVIIVDDVLTSGDTLVESVRKAREQGFKVVGCAVVLDRQECDLDKLEGELGVKVHSFFKKEEFILFQGLK